MMTFQILARQILREAWNRAETAWILPHSCTLYRWPCERSSRQVFGAPRPLRPDIPVGYYASTKENYT